MNIFVFVSALLRTFQRKIRKNQQERKTVQQHEYAQNNSPAFKIYLRFKRFFINETHSFYSAQTTLKHMQNRIAT